MKIAICTDRYLPAEGGVERYVHNIAMLLGGRHNVKIVAVLGARETYESFFDIVRPTASVDRLSLSDNLTISWLKPRVSPLSRLLLRSSTLLGWPFRRGYYPLRHLQLRLRAHSLARILAAELKGYDVVHTMAPWEISRAVVMAAPYARIVINGFIHEEKWAHDRYSAQVYRRCHRVIALTSEERRGYEERGVDRARIKVVPVPEPQMDSQAQSVALVPGPYFLFMGVKRAYKGVDLMIAAASAFASSDSALRFVIAGSETEFSRTLLKNTRLPDNVVWLGEVSDAQKYSLMKGALALCLLSESEIMPVSILEAWHCATAVIASSLPNLKEFCGQAALLVPRSISPLIDAMQLLATSSDTRSSLCQLGRTRLESIHSKSTVLSKLEDAYSEV